MPRKKGKLTSEAVELWQAETEMRGELAADDFATQDFETKAAIERIARILKTGANGLVKIDGEVVSVDEKYLNMNVLYVAIEIVKNLAFQGFLVANFKFDPNFCASCGVRLKKGA